MQCVICGKSADVNLSSFCSARCQQVDLNRWLTGSYRVPTDEVPDESDLAALPAHLIEEKKQEN